PEDDHVGAGFLLEALQLLDEVPLDQPRVAPLCLVQGPREYELPGFVHPLRDLRHRLDRLWRWPEALHHVVGLAPEDEHASRPRVPGDEFAPLGIVGAFLGPADVVVGAAEISVGAHAVEYG